MKMPDAPSTRRDFLQCSSIAGAALLSPALAFATPQKASGKGRDAGNSPAEDLMREHGVLNRVLLIYDEHLRRLTAKQTFDGSVLASAADIIRHFVEEYHEKLEEDFLFPRFRKAGKLVNLVDTLLAQHKAGRELTAQIRELASLATLKYVSDTDKLGDALRAFLRMYRPHEAREDTVLFPAFRSIVSAHEYDALG
jgi:hemerythrin-like domain-containing protein